MAKLIAAVAAATAVAAAGAWAAVLFLRRLRTKASRWHSAKDAASSWSKTAAQGAGKAAVKVAGRG